MWVLDIRTDYRERGQEIKNEPSIRIFLLHQQIIEEGFIDYWQSLSPGPLFPLGQDNRRGDAASRDISISASGCAARHQKPVAEAALQTESLVPQLCQDPMA